MYEKKATAPKDVATSLSSISQPWEEWWMTRFQRLAGSRRRCNALRYKGSTSAISSRGERYACIAIASHIEIPAQYSGRLYTLVVPTQIKSELIAAHRPTRLDERPCTWTTVNSSQRRHLKNVNPLQDTAQVAGRKRVRAAWRTFSHREKKLLLG